jgi:aryl-alcohol dehydrogenase-like predicted oxidoreductase
MNYRELGKTGIKVSEIGLRNEHLNNQPRETVVPWFLVLIT